MNFRNFLTLTIRVQDFNLVAKQPDLVEKLRELTLSPTSGLNFELTRMLKDAKQRAVDCRIILASRFGNLAGWAILSKEDTDYPFAKAYNGFRSEQGYLFQAFVSEPVRRQGIGSELMKTAFNLAKGQTVFVCPWDERSEGFYYNFEDGIDRL